MNALRPTVDLLRHGKTLSADIFRGRIEDPLSEDGWAQMKDAVSGRQWDAVVSSPLGRCREFAIWQAQQLGVEAIIDDGFAEYHFGDWDGERYDVVMAEQSAMVEAFFADPFAVTPPNAESFTVFHARVIAAWNRVVEAHAGTGVLVVTHGGVILSILADIFGRDRIHGMIDVAYASMSRIRPGMDGLPHQLISHGPR